MIHKIPMVTMNYPTPSMNVNKFVNQIKNFLENFGIFINVFLIVHLNNL